MADKKIPFSTFLFGAMGAGALVRALWNPRRAVARRGRVAYCAGAECSPDMALECDGPVYAVGAGRVVLVRGNTVHVRVSNEPVILGYDGLAPNVQEGQYVMRGQPLGKCQGVLYFSVWGISAGGTLGPLEPASWLASRGYRPLVKTTSDRGMWCEQPRRIEIPPDVHTRCGIVAGEEPAFALLPVSVREV